MERVRAALIRKYFDQARGFLWLIKEHVMSCVIDPVPSLWFEACSRGQQIVLPCFQCVLKEYALLSCDESYGYR